MSGPHDAKKDAVLILFGITTWDYLTSLWFEYRLITRKIQFRWQFFPYFIARYSVLTLSTMTVVDTLIDSPTHPSCMRAAFGTAILYFGLSSIAFGTWNLITRTVIIWGHHPIVMRLLFGTGLIHFALALITASIKRPPCSPPGVLSVLVFGFGTATIEFAILVLSLVGIRRATENGGSRLSRLLKTQGIAYFAAVLMIQVATIILNLTHTAGETRMWVGVTGAILSPILSCRLVVSTLSQNDNITDGRLHRIERFELSESQSQHGSAGRITTCIEIEATKDEGVC